MRIAPPAVNHRSVAASYYYYCPKQYVIWFVITHTIVGSAVLTKTSLKVTIFLYNVGIRRQIIAWIARCVIDCVERRGYKVHQWQWLSNRHDHCLGISANCLWIADCCSRNSWWHVHSQRSKSWRKVRTVRMLILSDMFPSLNSRLLNVPWTSLILIKL